ncbi:MAG: hypothetical protein OQK24_10895 [Magnetovibrio sp.]|nr:hypothetical protein [Magnetovibrio sp.]
MLTIDVMIALLLLAIPAVLVFFPSLQADLKPIRVRAHDKYAQKRIHRR